MSFHSGKKLHLVCCSSINLWPWVFLWFDRNQIFIYFYTGNYYSWTHLLPQVKKKHSLVILKLMLQNHSKMLKKYFICTTWTVMLSAGWNLQPHTGVWPIVKGLTLLIQITQHSVIHMLHILLCMWYIAKEYFFPGVFFCLFYCKQIKWMLS